VGLFTLLGAWLRLDRLELMEYKFDEAEMYRLASLHASGRFQLAGMTSGVGVQNPPVAVHLFSLVRAASADPQSLVYLPVALGVLAVPLCFAVTRAAFGLTAGLAASLLFATAPWAVMYSRKVWAQDLLPCFTVVLMGCAVRLVRDRRPVFAGAFAVILAIMVQIHYSALALAAVGLALMVMVRTRRVYAGWGVGVALAALSFAPFLVYQARRGFEDVSKATDVAQGRRTGRAGVVETFRHLRNLVSYNWFRRYVVGDHSRHAFDAQVTAPQRVPVAAACLFGAGVLAAACQARRRPEAVLLLVWLAAGMLLWSLAPSVAHYQIVALPAPFMAMGLLLEAARPRGSACRCRWLRAVAFWALAIGFLALAAAHVVFFKTFLDFIERNGGTRGDYNVAYRYRLAAARAIGRISAGRPYALAEFTGINAGPAATAALAAPFGAGQWDRKAGPDTHLGFTFCTPDVMRKPKGFERTRAIDVGPYRLDVWERLARPDDARAPKE